jgi:hypothetical protein
MAVTNVEHSTDELSSTDYPRGQKGDRQALVQLQRDMWKRSQDPKTPAHIAAQCARAWRDLQDMKRIMDGKPLPGQLRPDLQQVKQNKRKPSLLPLPEVPSNSDSVRSSDSAKAGESSSVSGNA